MSTIFARGRAADLCAVLPMLCAAVFVSMAGAPASAADALPGEIPSTFVPKVDSFDYVKREVMIPMRDGVKLQTADSHSARRASRAHFADPHALRRHGAHCEKRQRSPGSA